MLNTKWLIYQKLAGYIIHKIGKLDKKCHIGLVIAKKMRNHRHIEQNGAGTSL